MNAATFQFSNTAKSYVEHLDLLLVGKESESKKVEELMAENSSVIQAMQDKTIANLAEFVKGLDESLGACTWGKLRLMVKKTNTTKVYRGVTLSNYWLEPNDGKEKTRRLLPKISYITYALPAKSAELNRNTWGDYWGFSDLISHSRLKFFFLCRGQNQVANNKLEDLARNTNFCTYIRKSDYDHKVWLELKPEDPVGSASSKIQMILSKVGDFTG